MVKPRRGVLFLAGAGLFAAAWLMLRPAPPAPARPASAASRRGRSTTPTDEIPRIDLARLDSLAKLEKIEAAAGDRDPGGWPAPPPAPPPVTVAEAPPVTMATPPPGPPPPPPLNMTYLGNLEGSKGLKVAVFLTDKKIVLHGREGEIVGSRVRIKTIGIESVDVEDLSSGRAQRLALPKKGTGGTDAGKDARDRGRDRDSDREGGRDRDPGGNI